MATTEGHNSHQDITEAIASLIGQAVVSLEQTTKLYERFKDGLDRKHRAATFALNMATENIASLEQERSRKIAVLDRETPDGSPEDRETQHVFLEAYYNQQRDAFRKMIRDHTLAIEQMQADAIHARDLFEPILAQHRENIKRLQMTYRQASK